MELSVPSPEPTIQRARKDLGIPSDPTPSTSTIRVAFDSVYTWNYEVARPDLRALYQKAKGAQWDAQTLPDWSIHVDPEDQIVPDEMIPIYGSDLWKKLDPKREIPKLRQYSASYVLSNFLHGEQGALLAASQIVGAVPHADAKFYAATQVMDEARHVEAYERFLREKVELTFPISPYLRSLLDVILQESRWDMKYLGMQIMVEGLALAAFGFIHHASEEPLVRQITHMIMQDEARHVAFGVLSLKGLYTEMSSSELRDREDLILDASRLLRDRFMLEEVWERMGMPVDECVAIARESLAMKVFRAMLFSKIVPNVKRLGLMTPRVRQGFDELGVLPFENCDPTA